MSSSVLQTVAARRMPRSRTCFTVIRRQAASGGFFDDACKDFYLARLLHCQQAYQIQLHAFLLTEAQIFLLFTPWTPCSFDSFLAFLNKNYNDYYLTRFERRTQVWQEKSLLCLLPRKDLILDCQKFIERYLLDVGKAAHPGEYPYSSYCVNAFNWRPKLLQRHSAIEEFMRSGEDPLRRYRDFIATPFREEYARFLKSRLLHGRQLLSRKENQRLEKRAALTDI